MAETFPRWNFSEVDFVETDAEAIKSEIITVYEKIAGRTLAEGDPVRLFLLSLAAILIQQRSLINAAAQQNLLTYAQGSYLEALGVLLNVTRLPASKAETTIRFTLSQALANTYTIPKGFEVTNGEVTFATDSETTIPAGVTVVDVAATCETAGTVGNGYLAGQISSIVTPKTFLASAVNMTETSGGSDQETDEALANRIHLAANAFSVAGPEQAYKFHAYSVNPGVIDVSVDSPEPGQVKIYPLMTGGELPSEEVVQSIQDYLSSDKIRPLTDEVEVLAPTPIDYSINVDYWISKEDAERSEEIQAAVEAAANEYMLWQQNKVGRDIAPEKLVSLIIAAGAIRVDSETLSPDSFQVLAPSAVAQCFSVTTTYQGTKDI